MHKGHRHRQSSARMPRVIAKTEQEAAYLLMGQLRRHAPDEGPPALATDGLGAYREAMLFEWGKVPEYSGHGRPPTLPLPGEDWKYLQIVKIREGSRLVDVTPKVIYGDPDDVKSFLGENTSYVERTHLTSRQMNGRLVEPRRFPSQKSFVSTKRLVHLKMPSTILPVLLGLCT